MKKVILSSVVLLTVVIFACNKSKNTPSNAPVNQTQSSTTASTNNFGAKAVATQTMEPNLNGGPNDPLCISGPAHCVGVVVIINGFTNSFRAAIANNTLPTFLTDENIALLSTGDDGTINTVIADLLISVRNEEKKYTIVEAPMPNAQGVNAAFVIGHTGNMPTSNYEGAVVIKQL